MSDYNVQQYRDQAILSMTKGELLLALFDEALKNLRLGIMMLDNRNIETFQKCVEKCKSIFNYLSSILNRQYPVSQELYELYSFLNQEVIRAEIRREKEILEPLIPIVEDMRETWAEADIRARMQR